MLFIRDLAAGEDRRALARARKYRELVGLALPDGIQTWKVTVFPAGVEGEPAPAYAVPRLLARIECSSRLPWSHLTPSSTTKQRTRL